MDQGDIVKAHCNQCSGERKHLVVHFYKTDWNEVLSDDPPARMYGEDQYELLQCAGCDAITLRHTSYHSEVTDDEGRNVPTINYYPPSTFRRIPSWTHGATVYGGKGLSIIWMPDFVTRLIPEIYAALHAKSYSLAAMGVRALLESIMIQQVGDKGSFQKNMHAFHEAGGISTRQKTIIADTLEVGHGAIHRGYVPTRSDIVNALDIAEGLIETIYINEGKAKKLRERVPPKK
jgi:hypothetical protein